MIDVDRYQFNAQNWEFLASYDILASKNGNANVPIPPQDSNLIIDNKLVAIFIDHGGVQASWTYGGQVQQIVQTGITISNPFNSILKKESLQLSQWNLFEPSPSINDWSLRFTVPKWFPRWVCRIWGYTGTINNDLDTKLEGIKSDIATLQNDFDVHFGL